METRTFTGGCQCGAVRFEATGVDTDKTMACNCSRCGRLGLILSFVPIENFKLVSGEEQLTLYNFNKHVIHHMFCKVCGVQSFAYGQAPDGKKMAAINVRSLDGVDVHELKPKQVDGRKF